LKSKRTDALRSLSIPGQIPHHSEKSMKIKETSVAIFPCRKPPMATASTSRRFPCDDEVRCTISPDNGNAPAELDRKTLLEALLAFKRGDFSRRLPIDLEGVDGKIADAFNEVIAQNQRMSDELGAR